MDTENDDIIDENSAPEGENSRVEPLFPPENLLSPQDVLSPEQLSPERVELLRVPLDIVSDETLDGVLWKLLKQSGGNNVVLLSLPNLLAARTQREYRPFVHNAALVLPISKSLQRGCRFLTKKTPLRPMPFDFIIRLLVLVERQNATVYLLGGRDKTLRVTEKKIHATFPRLRIVGRNPGYFKKQKEALILEAIRKAAPSLLLVARGVRGGEKWLARNDKLLNSGMRLWCSDIFDVFAGRRRRPPRALFNVGLEWLPFLARRPFRFFRLFPWLYYNILLLASKIVGKK